MLQIKRTIGPKGQIVLPKDIRDQFNFREGTEITFIVEGNEIKIQPAIDPIKFVEEFCAPGKSIKKKLTAKEIKDAIMEQYEERLGRK
ncbi:MAG TPA: AbrB/MazE/SpoVT family DNA-binding domain-containing protein [Candidatus Nanoarchaeia archaeon]|nr:AbrB/MazE/SpoVT family DNA-binding domain-containing protein [Candidatus Nanoarchaeia archaeon]